MNRKGALVLIIVVVIALVAIGGYAVFYKSSKSPVYSSNQSNSNTPSQPASTPASSGTASIVQVKNSADVGQYLADMNGAALYTYGQDSTGTSNCSDTCLAVWPIYAAGTSSGSLPAHITVITRKDGTKQYAYKGMPLYTFSDDPQGQVTGDNVSGFHIAKP